MTATYTFDIFSTLDGYGSYTANANWADTGASKAPSCSTTALPCTARSSGWSSAPTPIGHLRRWWTSSTDESGVRDPRGTRMSSMPATVVSTTLEGPLDDWPYATLVSGDAVDVVGRLKEESEVPVRSHGSLSLNRALMAAGLVDRVQVTLFPVITGQTGLDPIFQGAADFDLELLEHRTLDGHIQELIYRPTLH
jgi:dihydrofolate reductase